VVRGALAEGEGLEAGAGRAAAIGLLASRAPRVSGRAWKGRGKWYDEARRRARARDGPGCAVCGAVDVPLELDHVIPVADRPELEWDFDNVQLLCAIDHKAKSAREARERIARRRTPKAGVGPSRRW
jgi:5-methylcytosine-specific restriction endonuclease McrA